MYQSDKTSVKNSTSLQNNLINTTFDPTRQNNPSYKTIYQSTSNTLQNNQFSPPSNTSLKHSGLQTTTITPKNVDSQVRQQGIPTHPNHPSMIKKQEQEQKQEQKQKQEKEKDKIILADRISDKIYNHFKNKYPNTIEASGFNKSTIIKIVLHSIKNQPLDSKSINKIIEIIDHKFKLTVHSDNRQGIQYDTTNFSIDTESKIPIEKYLENYNNKVTILLDSDKTVESELPKNMAPANDMVKIEKIEPFSEDFPIRDREKQTDMMIPEIREYDYYVVINSDDRNTNIFVSPNNFIIDFAPAAPASPSDTRIGYIERNFHNIKSCELMNVIIRDTSDQPDSSDANGASYPYLLLQFDELERNYYGTNDYLSKAFAILTDYSTVGKYKYYRMVGDSSESTVTRVYNPRINLNKITTKLLLPNGTPFYFGSVNDNNTSNTCISFGLRVVTIQKNLATQYITNA
jgi:hypothetical protein